METSTIMIQTSNYSRKGQDPTAIAISYSVVPQVRAFCSGIRHMPELGPSGALLGLWKAGKITEEEYSYIYLDLLTKRNLSPTTILEMLPDDCYLICYEKPYEFCHRRILADYIYKDTGVYIPEWLTDEENERFKKAAKQQDYVESVLEF